MANLKLGEKNRNIWNTIFLEDWIRSKILKWKFKFFRIWQEQIDEREKTYFVCVFSNFWTRLFIFFFCLDDLLVYVYMWVFSASM